MSQETAEGKYIGTLIYVYTPQPLYNTIVGGPKHKAC